MKADTDHVAKLKLLATTQATSYSFGPENGHHGDWAICTVNDATGELSVQSDWGNWSHRWNPDPKHLGAPTLTAFIADRSSCHYLADKLSPSEGRQAARMFDAEATIAEFRGVLLERRKEDARRWSPSSLSDRVGDVRARSRLLDRETAREIWDELGRLDRDNVDAFLRGYYEIDGVGTFISEEPYEHLASCPTPAYLVLLHGILPALVAACEAKISAALETTPSVH